MAALKLQPNPDTSTASSDADVPARDSPPACTTASDRDALRRDLVRALARSAAREAWALACSDHPVSQDTTS